MDTIIAALILAVIIAFVRIFAQKRDIKQLETKLENQQKQLAEVMAMVYLQQSQQKTVQQPSASEENVSQPISQPQPAPQPQPFAPIQPVDSAIAKENPSNVATSVTAAAISYQPIETNSEVQPNFAQANANISASDAPISAQSVASGNTQSSTDYSALSHKSTLLKPSHSSEDESATNIVTSLWASVSKWFFGENLVVRVGALVLLVGVVLLLKLASQYIHVSMPVRMALVAFGGFVITAVGYRTTAKKRNYGLTLQGVGFAVIYLTVFASFKQYGLLPPTLTFAMLALLAGLTVMFSVWQNALPLAVLAFGGAFFAPILVSRPDGSVVMLFSYYLLLNVAVAVIAHYRTWKLLNALSLAVTFGLAYVWGFRQFSTDSTGAGWMSVRWQLVGLLVAHMALYLFIAVRYSQQVVRYNQTLLATSSNNHPKRPIISIDSGLLFGTALLGFGLMASLLNDLPYHLAFASGALSAIYLALGFWLLKHHRQSIAGDTQAKNQFDNSFELLIEASLALGCGFLALVIPLALSAKWLSIGWAVQGAGLVWLGQRTHRRWTAYFGLALQAFSIVLLVGFDSIMGGWYALLDNLSIPHQAVIPDLSTTLPLMVLTACVLLSAFILRHGIVDIPSVMTKAKAKFKAPHGISTALVAVGFVLLISAIVSTESFWNNSGKTMSIKLALAMALFIIIGQLIHERFVWASMRKMSRLVLPFAMAMWIAVCQTNFAVTTTYDDTANGIKNFSGLGSYVLAMFGCLGAAKLLGIWLLSRWQREQLNTHADQLVWLLVLIGMSTVMLQELPFNYWQHDEELQMIISILPTVVSVLALTSLLLLPKVQSLLGRFVGWLDVTALLKNSAYLLVPITFVWALSVNMSLDGQLLGFYIPVLNPLDLTLISILLYQFFAATKFDKTYRTAILIACGLGAFVTVNSMLVRVFASVWGTPTWENGAWLESEVQTGLTILWTVIAMVLMFLANKKALRLVWFAGMALLALVVAKLLLIDMSNTSAVLRVVSFIGAGLLMLVIGYLAPLPPKPSQIK